MELISSVSRMCSSGVSYYIVLLVWPHVVITNVFLSIITYLYMQLIHLIEGRIIFQKDEDAAIKKRLLYNFEDKMWKKARKMPVYLMMKRLLPPRTVWNHSHPKPLQPSQPAHSERSIYPHCHPNIDTNKDNNTETNTD